MRLIYHNSVYLIGDLLHERRILTAAQQIGVVVDDQVAKVPTHLWQVAAQLDLPYILARRLGHKESHALTITE